MTSERLPACPLAALPPGSMLRVDRPDGGAIAVYNIDGSVYATDDRCTHAMASLTRGELEGDCIVCPVHFGTFHVPTGKALCFPVKRDLTTYAVEVHESEVYIVIENDETTLTDESTEPNPQEAA